jgi:hypothetical protein
LLEGSKSWFDAALVPVRSHLRQAALFKPFRPIRIYGTFVGG